jgi:predicted dehydrogenase
MDWLWGISGGAKIPTPHLHRFVLQPKVTTEFHQPNWSESWFPDAFSGTMAQLLVALEKNEKPAIDGRDNLMTMALVEAAYKSAETKRLVTLDEITGNTFREGPL